MDVLQPEKFFNKLGFELGVGQCDGPPLEHNNTSPIGDLLTGLMSFVRRWGQVQLIHLQNFENFPRKSVLGYDRLKLVL